MFLLRPDSREGCPAHLEQVSNAGVNDHKKARALRRAIATRQVLENFATRAQLLKRCDI